jgi:hypothetical protein
MTQTSDHELDELLRRSFVDQVPDDGFTARVMRALPSRPRRQVWLLPIAALAGTLLGWLALMPSPLLRQAASQWLSADLGGSMVLVCALLFGVTALGCAWALEET